MRKRIILFTILATIIFASTPAFCDSTWNGSSTTGNAYRTGNVSIGTTTMGPKLNVQGAGGSSTCAIKSKGNSGEWAGHFIGDNGSNSKGLLVQAGDKQSTEPGFKVMSYDTTKTFFEIKNNGNIGIGKSSTGPKLEVLGAGGASCVIKSIGNSGEWAGLFVGDNGESSLGLKVQAGNKQSNSSSFFVGSYDDTETFFDVRNNGNIGIGMSSTGPRLEVVGKGGTSSVIKSWGHGGEWAGHFVGDNGSNSNGLLIQAGDKQSDEPGFKVTSYDATQTFLEVQNNGNVGIGTTNPGLYKLAVEGKIGAREVVVTTASWADYVFKEDYKLPPLAVVEQHIKEKKHLPGIPSAKEVEENGLSMAAMMSKQMQKIEELTLYMIEMKKENERLKAEKEKMDARLAAIEKQLPVSR